MWWPGGNGGDDHRDQPPQELRHGHDRSRGRRRAIRPVHGHGDAYRDSRESEATQCGPAAGHHRRTDPGEHVNDVVGEGAVLSAFFFPVPPPGIHFDCFDAIEISRSVTLHEMRSLIARGALSADNGYTACAASVPVKIQRRVAGEWETVRTTTASPAGSYSRRIPDKAGRYRAVARRFSCLVPPPACGPSHPFGLEADRPLGAPRAPPHGEPAV
jgi:hypothetical protein